MPAPRAAYSGSPVTSTFGNNNMKLVDLNPFAPRDPVARAKFAAVFKRELLVYRKKPSFWIGSIVVVTSNVFIIDRLDTVGRLILLIMMFGLGLIYDTATSHLIK